MLKDSPPKKARLSQFVQSEGIKTLDLPQHGHLTIITKSIESAMKTGTAADVGHACAEFLDTASKFYSDGRSGDAIDRRAPGPRQYRLTKRPPNEENDG